MQAISRTLLTIKRADGLTTVRLSWRDTCEGMLFEGHLSQIDQRLSCNLRRPRALSLSNSDTVVSRSRNSRTLTEHKSRRQISRFKGQDERSGDAFPGAAHLKEGIFQTSKHSSASQSPSTAAGHCVTLRATPLRPCSSAGLDSACTGRGA